MQYLRCGREKANKLIAELDTRGIGLIETKRQATTLQRIHNLEVSRGDMVYALNTLREYQSKWDNPRLSRKTK